MAPDNRFRASIIASASGFVLLFAGAAGALVAEGKYGSAFLSLLVAATLAAAAWRVWEDRQ